MAGGSGRADFFFALAPGTKAAGETLVELDVSHSPLLVAPSTLTVAAGGVRLNSVAMAAGNTDHGRVTARVPAELIGENGLALSVRTYLRLTNDDCEDPANPALWATVHRSSTVRLSSAPTARDLADAGALLTRRGAPSVQLDLLGDPVGDALEAAGVVAAAVGRWQGEERKDALIGLGSVPGGGIPTVVVAAGAATPSGFPATWTGSGYTTGAALGTVPGDHGLVALAQEGTPRLLVGGATPAAVLEAAEALGAGLAGPVAAPAVPRPAPVVGGAAPWTDGAASFAQLGIGRQELTGLGRREVALQIDRPAGWAIKGDPRLDLVVDTAAGLDEEKSSIQVQLAGVDLGSRRVQRGGGPHTYGFDIPAGLIDRGLDGRAVRSLDLTVRLLLSVPHTRCEPVDVESAHATILPTSAFRLPHDSFGGRELGRFPHPLLNEGTRQVTVVLPDAPDTATLAAGIQFCAAVGRWAAAGSPPPLLITVGALDEGRRRVGGLVLLGGADVALLGREIELGAPTVTASPDRPVAVLGVVPSPFDGDRSALVVHGDGPALLLAARALGSRASLADMRGSQVAIQGTSPAVALRDIDEPTPPPELAPVLGGRSFVAENSWALPALVLLVGFLAALAILVWFRWASPRARSKGRQPG